jgi:hypothetical protein
MTETSIKYYWEDMPVGSTRDLGTITPTAEEIVAFATQFDPQPFHLDEEAAKQSVFGGLCASGWHTCHGFQTPRHPAGHRQPAGHRAVFHPLHTGFSRSSAGARSGFRPSARLW